MNTPAFALKQLARVVVACVAMAAAGCADERPATGLNAQVLAPGDTITGSGQLSELQEHRAAWMSRGIDDYQFQLQISCFCGGDITRPVVIEVRGGAIAKVRDVETGNAVANVSAYATITKLFDAAIAERSRGGNVSVAYDRALGIPVRLEVGTIANDAGVLYLVSALSRL
jgi:Family of unknown function (DUF6174)